MNIDLEVLEQRTLFGGLDALESEGVEASMGFGDIACGLGNVALKATLGAAVGGVVGASVAHA